MALVPLDLSLSVTVARYCLHDALLVSAWHHTWPRLIHSPRLFEGWVWRRMRSSADLSAVRAQHPPRCWSLAVILLSCILLAWCRWRASVPPARRSACSGRGVSVHILTLLFFCNAAERGQLLLFPLWAPLSQPPVRESVIVAERFPLGGSQGEKGICLAALLSL